jgi:VanZ family protein
VAGAAALSCCMEVLQLFSRSRMAAINDLIADAAGALAGGIVAAVFLPALWPGLTRRLSLWRARKAIALVAVAMAVLLAADALDPMDPVVNLSRLMRNLRRSHFQLASGLAVHPWHRWLVCRIGIYAVFTIVIGAAGFGRAGWGKWLRAAALAGAFALVTEACKPFMGGRIANVANVVMAACGCLVGTVLARALAGRIAPRTVPAAAALLMIIYIGYHEWTPFVFVWDAEVVRAKLPAAGDWMPGQEWIPLYRRAVTGRGTGQMRPFLRVIATTAALACTVGIRGGWFARGPLAARLTKAAVLTGALGAILEFGQALIPGRSPSPPHVLFFVLGGMLGGWLSAAAAARAAAVRESQ